MDLVPYLSTVIFVATIATVLLAVFSYAAFKLRDWRKPRESGVAPVFFHRFAPEEEPPGPTLGDSAGEDAADS